MVAASFSCLHFNLQFLFLFLCFLLDFLLADFSVKLSKWTVYKYINDGVFLRLTNKSLPMGGKKKQKHDKVQAARAPKGDSIEERPETVGKREEPFH